MPRITKIELNVIESFRLLKRDIIRLQREVAQLSQAQESALEILAKVERGK